jgi:type II secretory pathway pseudopilin PulG
MIKKEGKEHRAQSNLKGQVWIEPLLNTKNRKFFGQPNLRGQVWIETVIYLLIAFLMIGMVLSFVRPKIEELKDKSIIEQSEEILETIDNTIITMGVEGNKRIIDLGIKKGEFTFNGTDESIKFEMESQYVYTESGQKVQIGKIVAETKRRTDEYLIILTSDYSEDYNLTYKGREESKILSKSSVPYKLILSNEGEDSSGKTIINIDLG